MTEQDLFVAALQIDDLAERAAYLNRECGDDAGLRRRVEVLLRAHADAADFLESPPTGSYQSTTPLAETAGSWIGPYKLLQLIGEGGRHGRRLYGRAGATRPAPRRAQGHQTQDGHCSGHQPLRS